MKWLGPVMITNVHGRLSISPAGRSHLLDVIRPVQEQFGVHFSIRVIRNDAATSDKQKILAKTCE